MIFLLINGISLTLIISIFLLIMIFDNKNSQIKLKQIKLITFTSFLVALAVILNISSILVVGSIFSSTSYQIKIGNFVLVLIGLFCGGILGFMGGIANDVLGLLFLKTGPPCLYFTLTSILWCILPYYLIVIFSKIYYSNKSFYYYLLVAYALTSLFTLGFDPLILNWIYAPKPLSWRYSMRVLKYPFDLVYSTTLISICYRHLCKSLNLEYQFHKNYFVINLQKSLNYDTKK